MNQLINKPTNEPVKPSTHQSSNAQFVSMCAKARCARRNWRQIKELWRGPQWCALSPGYKKRQSRYNGRPPKPQGLPSLDFTILTLPPPVRFILKTAVSAKWDSSGGNPPAGVG